MASANGRDQLLEQLCFDQRERWAKGERVRAEEYLARHPDLSGDPESALEIIYNEVVLREEAGQRPRMEEYAERFPQLSSELKPLFEVHAAIEAAGRTDPFATVAPESTLATSPPDLDPKPRGESSSLAGPSPDPYATVAPGATVASPSSPSSPRQPTRAPVGGRFVIPGYEILDELGKGGMGVVYKARQVGLNRIVALKMILGGDLVGQEEVGRFRLEAESVAKLSHPNIVQVYEIGEMHGRPFFSLEFMEGGSLADKLTGTPLRARQAARLIQTLADAVHYAHEHQIVHRDLKPANILLKVAEERETTASMRNTLFSLQTIKPTRPDDKKRTQQPDVSPASTQRLIPDEKLLIPKITDFGLAKKVGDDSGRTRTGTIIGTPSYMAPEQAEGRTKEIGPSADIYALGAILYELVTGRPPFRAESALETIRQVVSQEPVPPRNLQPHLARDVETICLKCLQKDQRRRYATAGALSEDLRRFLANEPIQARPVSSVVRAAKWARRRPAWATLILIGAAILIALPVTGWLFAMQESRRAEEERQANLKIQAMFSENMAVVDDLLLETGATDLEDAPLMEQGRKRLLQKAHAYFTKFLSQHGDDPSVRGYAARAYSRLGEVRLLLGEHEQAEAELRQAIDLLTTLAAASPDDPEPRRELGRAFTNLGIQLRKLNRFNDAEAELRNAIRWRQELLDGNSAAPGYRQDLAVSHYWLGAVLAPVTGRRQDAEAAYREARTLQELLVTQDAEKPDYRRELARTLNNHGIMLMETRSPETEALFTRARDLQQELVTRHPDAVNYKRGLARTQSNLGSWLMNAGRIPPATDAFRAAETLLAELVASFPTVPDYQQDRAGALSNLGRALQTSDPLKAEEAYERALAVRTRLAEQFPKNPDYRHRLGLQYVNLGLLRRSMKRFDEAVHAHEEALAIQKQLVAEHPTVHDYRNRLANSHNHLAKLYMGRADAPLAALALFGEAPGFAGGLLVARSQLHLAWAHLREGIPHQRLALEASPQSASYRQALSGDLSLSAFIARRLGDHAAAAEAAEELARHNPKNGDELARAVAFLCNCIRDAEQDTRLAAAGKQSLVDDYGQRAVRILQGAIDGGNLNSSALTRILDSLRTIQVYEPLRGRDDFRRLIERAEGKGKPAVG
jgi:serine/threonine-protein kinase